MEKSEIKIIIDDVIKTASLMPDREVKLRIDMYSKYNIPISDSDKKMNKIFDKFNSYHETIIKKSSTYSHDFETRFI